MMDKEEVRQYWRHQKRMATLKVFCLSLIGTAILIAGCGETEEEINANNAKSRAAVETASANNNIKSTGSVIAKKVGGSATIILPDNQNWTFNLIIGDSRLCVVQDTWIAKIKDVALFKAGWVFRTYDEAVSAAPFVARELEVEYAV